MKRASARSLLVFLILVVTLSGLAASKPAHAAPSLRVQIDQHGSFALIGNTLGQECGPGTPAPVVGTVSACGTNTNDTSPDVFWRADSPLAGQAQADTSITAAQARSTSMLSLPAGAQVTHAYLYWAAFGSTGSADSSATLDRPGGFSAAVTALDTLIGSGSRYRSVADVTALVQANGNGAYRVSDVDVIELANINNSNVFASWWMVVFYRLDSDPLRNLTLYDGMDGVSSATPQNISLSGFLVPPGSPDARLGVVALDGDNSTTGDALAFNGTTLSDAQNPANNFFNSTRSTLGTPVSVAGDLPQLDGTAQSMSGLDLDIVDVSSLLSAGQSSASVAASTSGDVYFLPTFVTAITTFDPDLSTSTSTVQDLDGGTLRVGDTLEYTFAITNTGNDTATLTLLDDPLPAGLSYLPGSLEILTGANAGPKSDAAGDDQAEYVAASRKVVARLGAGADATQGGSLGSGESARLRFRATLDASCAGPTTIDNQATLTATGQLGGKQISSLSDGDPATAGSQPSRLSINLRCLTLGVSGSGRVTSSPAAIDCGASCSASLDAGTVLTLTATPAAGSIFSGWSGALSSTANPISITLDATKLVTATFARIPVAPGGVFSGMGLWLKADAGVFSDAGTMPAVDTANVRQWNDQSGAGTISAEASLANATNITYTSGALNFNPAVQFDGTSGQRLVGTASTPFGGAGTVIVVAQDQGSSSGFSGLFSVGPPEGGQGLYVDDQSRYVVDGTGASAANSANSAPASSTFHIVEASYSGASTQGSSLFLDGALAETEGAAGVGVASSSGFEIGGRSFGGQPQRIFRGKIAEIVYYSGTLTSSQRARVQSYLGIKYGLSLSPTLDYVASDGSVLWDGALNSDYGQRVFGIGRDAASGLNQLRSRSQRAGGVLSVQADTANLADKAFLLLGDDGATITTTSDVPLRYQQRILRRWKAQELGETGALTLSFDLSGFSKPAFANPAGFALLLDGDGTFSNASAITNATVLGNVVTFANVNVSSGQYLSLAFPISTTTAPLAPLILTPAEGLTVTTTRPTISGTGDPSAALTVSLGAQLLCATTVQPNGSWSCTPGSDLPQGEITLSAVQADAAGNLSPPSLRLIRVVVNLLTISSSAFSPGVAPRITGLAAPGSLVTVTLDLDDNPATNNSLVYTTTANAAGQWSIDTLTAQPLSGIFPGLGLPLGSQVGVEVRSQSEMGVASGPVRQVLTIGRGFIIVPVFVSGKSPG